MKSSKSILLFILTILSFHLVNAQEKVKLKCKKIELAYYETKGNNSTEIEVSNYIKINEEGIATIHLNGYKGLKYYSCQLNDELINKINQLLTDKKPLKRNLIKRKIESGHHYAGSYYYMSFENNENNESLCFIKSFMSPEFNLVFNQLEDIILKQSTNSEIENPKFDIKEIEERIQVQNKKSKYLPKIEHPQSM